MGLVLPCSGICGPELGSGTAAFSVWSSSSCTSTIPWILVSPSLLVANVFLCTLSQRLYWHLWAKFCWRTYAVVWDMCYLPGELSYSSERKLTFLLNVASSHSEVWFHVEVRLQALLCSYLDFDHSPFWICKQNLLSRPENSYSESYSQEKVILSSVEKNWPGLSVLNLKWQLWAKVMKNVHISLACAHWHINYRLYGSESVVQTEIRHSFPGVFCKRVAAQFTVARFYTEELPFTFCDVSTVFYTSKHIIILKPFHITTNNSSLFLTPKVQAPV